MSESNEVFNKNICYYILLINEFLLKNEWVNVEVGSILRKDTQKIKDAVLAKNYLKEGEFKIVSQSKDLFSGYSDDEFLLNNLTKPVIIFGDHTQVIKYIDFPFVLGADGVKVLEPSEEYGTKFFYYLLKAIDLNSNKYARHFSLLRKAKIPFKKDSLELQNSIVSYLSYFEKNALSEKTYFDFETEEKIKKLHASNINVSKLLDGFSDQKIYLTKLRQAILQEAIEGKLTADWRINNPVCLGDPNTDAAALLATIKAEKQALIADGKIKKDKPLAPINPDDVPFALPDSWVWVRLGDVCTKITDGFHNTPKRLQSGIRYISATHVKTHNIDWNNCNYVSEQEHKELWNKAYPQKGEILIVNIGAGCATPAIIDVDYEFSFKNTAILKSNQNLISNRYFLNHLISQKENTYNELTQGGLQPFLSLKVLNGIFFSLSPLAEQQAIVERVDRLLNHINALEQQVTERKHHAEQLMQAVLKEAFAG